MEKLEGNININSVTTNLIIFGIGFLMGATSRVIQENNNIIKGINIDIINNVSYGVFGFSAILFIAGNAILKLYDNYKENIICNISTSESNKRLIEHALESKHDLKGALYKYSGLFISKSSVFGMGASMGFLLGIQLSDLQNYIFESIGNYRIDFKITK